MTTPGVTKCDVVITVEVSAGGIAAVDGQRDADDEAGSGAAQPQDRGGDLLAASEPADRLPDDGIVHAELAAGDHPRDHRRLDGAGADGVDADPARRVLQRGALGEAEDAVLGGMVGGAAGVADEAAERRTVDDRAAALLAHLAQLVLHARPHAAQVDRGDAVEAAGRLVGGVAEREHDARVVVGHVEPAELSDGPVHQRGDLRLVGDVAGDAERAVAGGGQLVGRGAQCVLVDVGEHDGRAGRGERAGGVESHAGCGAGDERDLAGEVVGRVHADSPPAYCSSLTCSPHVTGEPDWSFSCMATWAIKRFGAAPCQWFSPGSMKTRSPGRSSSIRPPSRWQSPTPSVTKIVCPCGWVWQAVRAPGVKCTSAAANVEVPAGAATASM